jgi:chromosomal replication initiator protein
MPQIAVASVWPEALERIRARVSGQQYATWFQNLRAAWPAPDELQIRVPNNFFREWLAENYLSLIQDCVAEVSGARPRITFQIDSAARAVAAVSLEDIGPASSFTPPMPVAPPPRPQGLRLNENYTFDTFVVGPSNQLAYAAAMSVSEAPGRSYNPLFLYGSVGLGKSHLLQAICHANQRKTPAVRMAYLSCETFVNEFISALQRKDMGPFRARYRQMDFLLIDDIQFLCRTDHSQEEFFHTFNDLFNAQKQIIVSSDQPPQDINGLQERLISRFKSGLVARIDPPSYEMRIAILNRKAELRRVRVPVDVIEYIANAVTSNIRELDGAITKVVGYASLLNQPISLEVARNALHEPGQARSVITIDDILRVVTAHFSVRVADLQSKKRTRSIVLPRQVCMYLARSLTMLSLEEIGGYFGGRDHSTVLHAEAKIAQEVERDDTLRRAIDDLKRKLNNPAVRG